MNIKTVLTAISIGVYDIIYIYLFVMKKLLNNYYVHKQCADSDKNITAF